MAVESALPAKEPIFRIEYTPSGHLGLGGRLTIQMLSRLSTEMGGGALMPAGSSAESKWSAYVDSYVKLDSNARYLSQPGSAKVYLNRNKVISMSNGPSSASGSDSITSPISSSASPAPLGNPPANLLVQYNLECKISINTYKLFYVENTEDFLYRFKVTRRGRVNVGIRKRRFAKFLATRR
jgi:paired amphipathic helix protein Sin3a